MHTETTSINLLYFIGEILMDDAFVVVSMKEMVEFSKP